MDIDIKNTRPISYLSEIGYGECFEVINFIHSKTNYADKFVGRYLMKIKCAVRDKPDKIMFVDLKNGEIDSLPCQTSIRLIPAKVEVKL